MVTRRFTFDRSRKARWPWLEHDQSITSTRRLAGGPSGHRQSQGFSRQPRCPLVNDDCLPAGRQEPDAGAFDLARRIASIDAPEQRAFLVGVEVDAGLTGPEKLHSGQTAPMPGPMSVFA
jgi:hypothetical protein